MSVLRLHVRQQRGSDQLPAAGRVGARAVTAGGGGGFYTPNPGYSKAS